MIRAKLPTCLVTLTITVVALLPIHVGAQKNTIDSLQLLLNHEKNDTTRAELLRIIGFAYRFRDFTKAEEYFELANTAAQKIKDTVRMAQVEAELALYYFQGRAIHHLAVEHFERADQLLQKRNDSISVALKGYIFWHRTLLIHNTVSTTYNMNLGARELFFGARNGLKKILPVLEGNRFWIEAANVYFFFSSTNTINLTLEEGLLDQKLRLQYLYDMEKVYRNANYWEGVGIALAHIARYIHFMGIGGMAEYQQGKPWFGLDTKKPSAIANDFPMDWRWCLILDEIRYRSALKILTETGNTQRQGVVYNGLSYKYIERKQYDSALLYYRNAVALARKMNDIRELLHYAQTPPDIYIAKGDYKSASLYYYNYVFLSDSLNQTNNSHNIAALERSYAIQSKENEIDKLQAQAEYQQIKQRQQVVIFAIALGFLIVVLGLGAYSYQQRRRSNKQLTKNLELQGLLQKNLEQLLNEAQLTAARAQMNPHFVYNSINAIQNLILKENKSEAIVYLNDFSKLTRETLENSSKETITLKEEISFLNHYLQLEVLRGADKFEYTLSCDPEIDVSYDRIPPMLIQPFVENSIKHGILPKLGKGALHIDFKKQGEDTLVIVVSDDGVGRNASQKPKREEGQHQSMATGITETRIQKMSERKPSAQPYTISIEDLVEENGAAAGTRVTIVVPLDLTKSLTA